MEKTAENYGELLYKEDLTQAKKQSRNIGIALSIPLIGFCIILMIGLIQTGHWQFLLFEILIFLIIITIWSEYYDNEVLEIRQRALIIASECTPPHLKIKGKDYKNKIIPFDEIEIIYPNTYVKGSETTLAMPDGPIKFKSSKKRDTFLYYQQDGRLYVVIKLKDSTYRCFNKQILPKEIFPEYRKIIPILEERTLVSKTVIMLVQKPPGTI